jgi:hypothetical protein
LFICAKDLFVAAMVDRAAGSSRCRLVGGKVTMPANLRRIDKYMLDVEHIDHISDEMRAVVESEWPELAHKLPLNKQSRLAAGCSDIELARKQHHEEGGMANAAGDATGLVAGAPVEIGARRSDAPIPYPAQSSGGGRTRRVAALDDRLR